MNQTSTTTLTTLSPLTRTASQTHTVTGIAASWETVVAPHSFRSLRVSRHLEAKWLALTLTEQGSRSRRETMITLSPGQVQKLKELLDQT